MAGKKKQKTEVQIIPKGKENRPMALTLYDKMPSDLQGEIDALVRTVSSTKDFVMKVLELGKKYDFTFEELGIVVKYQLVKAGIHNGAIFKQLAEIKPDKKTKDKAADDADKEAATEIEQDIGFIDINFDEIDVDAVIEQMKTHKKARIYYSKETNDFVKIEFMKK